MKITKKMRKKANGMNADTKKNFEKGFSNPVFHNVAPPGNIANFVKVANGVPYVNPKNFM